MAVLMEVLMAVLMAVLGDMYRAKKNSFSSMNQGLKDSSSLNDLYYWK